MITRALARGFLGFLAGASLVFACSSDDPPTFAAKDAGPNAPSPDAKVFPGFPDAEIRDPAPPDGLPAGWELERSFDKTCNFYVPRTRDLLPPPIRWEPCPPIAIPAGVSCRVMANPAGIEGVPPSAGAARVTPNGTVLLSVRYSARPRVDGDYWAITEADGPAHTAILAASTSRCTRASPSLFGGRYTLTLYDGSTLGGGLFAGEIDDLRPRITIHLSKEHAHSVYAGPFAILDLNKGFLIEQYSWTDGSPLPVLWSPARDNGLQQGSFVFASDAMFWAANTLDYHKVKLYTPAGGVQDFLSAGLVMDHGHDDLGTDGKDLVWIEARGRKSGGTTPFETYDIMTAPYTTNPTKVAPRRLRSEIGPSLGVTPFVVGCGYAVRPNGRHLRVVRLSDGQSWTLEQAQPDTDWQWTWSDPLAITCTELFAVVGIRNERSRFVRVRIDSLGPGIAAD